jgi:glycosyltransferase XagB
VAPAARRHRRPGRGGSRWTVPSYTILVAAYHEQEVIGARWCLENIDYPKDRLDALILIERRDEATKQAIADANPAEFIRIVEIPPGALQTKPRSCNAGLLLGQGRPDRHLRRRGPARPGQLRVVAAQFAAANGMLACVQAKLMVANAAQNFTTRQFALDRGPLEVGGAVPQTALKDLQLWRLRERKVEPGLGEEAFNEAGRYCIRFSRVFTSVTS